ncbi:hypothetical protein [Marinobacter sp. F3R11]|uniref:hypothetical protein n=1 Tax=Marinobacter sp. F3R11 TaxID=2267231 RepID=UPI000DE9BF0D|nr:hypothetical protein [Marinobacter sp. F3R11]RBW49078.1 hypothetical protein DS878_13210 [Marinobacter sp. F3R11]
MSEFDESNLGQSRSWDNENDDAHSITGRARVREQLQQDIEKFLSQGGRIQEVETTFRSDSSRKVGTDFNNRSF